MEASVGRGQSIPSPPVRRPEEGRRYADVCTGASLPPPFPMHLDHQGPPVTYSEAGLQTTPKGDYFPNELEMCNMQIKITACKKEKEATQVTLDQIWKQEQDEQAALRKEKEHDLRRVHQCKARCKLVKEGAWWQEEYNYER